MNTTQTQTDQDRTTVTVFRPQFATSFVAVETSLSKRPADIVINGTAASQRVYPEVIVQAYARAKVKDVIDGRSGNARVIIDAASVVTQKGGGLKHDIQLNTSPDSDCAWYARQALADDAEVFFAFEQRRKTKNSTTGEFIPFTTPIRQLAGITDGSTGQNQQAAAANLSKALVAIGPADDADRSYVSDEARCDPTAWALFSNNYDGSVTPEGFTRPTDAEGAALGCLIRTQDAPATPTTHTAQTDGAEAASVNRSQSLRTHTGEINPDSTAVATAATARRRARQAVRAAVANTDEQITSEQKNSAAEQLTGVLLWLADRVQQDVAGQVDRTATSHTIAADQVDEVMDFEQPYSAELIDDQDAATAWAAEVRHLAVDGFRAAIATTEQWAATLTVAESPDLLARWNSLIAAIGMSRHADRVTPLLVDRFGTSQPHDITAGDFANAVTSWEHDPQQFLNEAKQAYQATQDSNAQ